jgi:hypothetical protein
VLTTFPSLDYTHINISTSHSPDLLSLTFSTIDGRNCHHDNNHRLDTPQHSTTSDTGLANCTNCIALEPETKKIILPTYHYSRL